VTALRDPDAALREAFEAHAARSPRECSPEDLDRIWRAVSGDLDGEARRDVIDRMATDPALAHAWRVAHELERARAADSPLSPRQPNRWLPAALMGLAATVIAAIGITAVYRNRPADDTFRAASVATIEPLVATDAALPRDAFVLRWKPGPAGARYAVRVTSEDLRVLATATELTDAEFTVPRESLAGLESGARVLWQVVMSVPGGDTVQSHTFVVKVQ
jgi:hypothetical protein